MKSFKENITQRHGFDYIVQNAPYNGTMHLDFFQIGLNILASDGKMNIVEPANTLYTDLKRRKNFINYVKNNEIKIKKVIIDNFNDCFSVDLRVPFSITYIDNSIASLHEIEYIEYKNKTYVKTIEDVNLYGDIEVVNRILSKLENQNIYHHAIDFYFPGKEKSFKKLADINNAAYLRNSGSMITLTVKHGFGSEADKVIDEFHKKTYNEFITCLYTLKKKSQIYKMPELQDNLSNPNGWIYCNMYDTFEDNEKALKNFQKFILNSNLAHFINWLVIGATNRRIMPLYIDDFTNDLDIYYKFGLDADEIECIESNISKIERYSEWMNAYIFGNNKL